MQNSNSKDFVRKLSVDSFHAAIDQMVDHACDPQTEQEISQCAAGIRQVLGVDMIHTRKFGGRIYVDLEIRMDKNLSLLEPHKTAESVHTTIEQRFPKVKHVMVYVNPSEQYSVMQNAEKTGESFVW